MHPIIYDVAVSLDGFIAGLGGDVTKFTYQGPVVEDYLARMAQYRVCIMGKATYEYGYQVGMRQGENPYKHMKTKVFSTSLEFDGESEVELVRQLDAETVTELRTTADGPIYLCGGGELAGSLLDMGAIDEICLKRSPIVLGGGISLFGQSAHPIRLSILEVKEYASGHILERFAVLPDP